MTHNRRIRLEVTCPDADPHIPSVVAIYPTNDWHERETFDFFGIIFDGHPALTRIQMPDDWPGPPAAQGLPAGRHPGRVQGRHHPTARHAEVLQLMTDDHRRSDPVRHHRAPTPPQGRVFTVTGQDWDSSSPGSPTRATTSVVVNMGPQHPSTHGVLRLILELEGETVTEARCGIGYLHTGIEKNMEFRSWVQGVTFCTRMDYLSPVLQRGDLLPRRRAAARHRGRHPGEGAGHARPPDGAQPDLLPPGLHRHRRHGDRRADRDDDRLPRARAGARPVRADHRPADEPRVHPPRRRRPGPAARRARPDPRLRRADEEAAPGVRRALQRQPDLQGAASRASATSTSPAAWRSASPARSLRVDRLPVGPAQDPALLRLRGLRLRGADLGHLPTPTAGSGSGSTRCGSRCRSSSRRRPARRPRGRAGDGRPTRRSPGPASSRSAATAWATASTTSGTSWASRWRP